MPAIGDTADGGLAILKHMHNLSDEVLCERWLENRDGSIDAQRSKLSEPFGMPSTDLDAIFWTFPSPIEIGQM